MPDKDGEFGRQDMRFVTANNIFGVDPTTRTARTTSR